MKPPPAIPRIASAFSSSRILIYLFPALIDLVVALMQFVSTTRAPKLGATATGTGAVIVIWGLFYLPSCFALGRIVTPKNAALLLQVSCFAMAGISALFLLISSLDLMYVLMAFTGVATAFFFVPFQIFMKTVDEEDDRALASTTACYTFAWSAGYALAPLIAGHLMMVGIAAQGEAGGWRYCYLLSGAAALATAAGLRLVRNAPTVSQPAALPPTRATVDYEQLPSYAWLAWTAGGVAILAYSALRSIFQEYAYQLALSDAEKGTILFVLSMTQALVGLSFLRSRVWMYRWTPLLLFGCCGLAGLACFGCGKSPAIFLTGALFYGVYSGSLFFYFTFHALTHAAVRVRHVAINEMVFGSASLLGPLLGGLLADHVSPSFPYLFFGLLLAPCLVLQAMIHFRDRRQVDAVSRTA